MLLHWNALPAKDNKSRLMLLEMQMSLQTMKRCSHFKMQDMNASSELDCRERTLLPKLMEMALTQKCVLIERLDLQDISPEQSKMLGADCLVNSWSMLPHGREDNRIRFFLFILKINTLHLEL